MLDSISGSLISKAGDQPWHVALLLGHTDFQSCQEIGVSDKTTSKSAVQIYATALPLRRLTIPPTSQTAGIAKRQA